MNEIRLKRLTLRDFQGGTFTLNTKGQDVFIFADNAVGKTRLVSGFTWLLFGKDALGRSDFDIKNLDAQGEAAHGLEHTVEAELSIEGETHTLKKVFKEKWTKKRGNAQREFSGHTVDYAVDGVPLQEKAYIDYTTNLAGDESRFRLLTSPMVFPALHWQKQRQILMDICGDIKDADVIASKAELEPLIDILGKRTMEDHRKVITARRTEINKEIEKIPIRIDEVRRGMPDVAGLNLDSAQKDVHALETILNDKKLRLQGVNTGGDIATLTAKIAGLRSDVLKIESIHRSESSAALNQLNQRCLEIEAKIVRMRRGLTETNNSIEWKEKNLHALEIDLSNLREKWILIDTETFKDTTASVCVACGQDLPTDKVQAAREKALANFNQSKAERWELVDRSGHNLKEQNEKIKAEIETLKTESSKLAADIHILESELTHTKEDHAVLRRTSDDFSGLERRADLLGEIEDLESQIKAERDGKAQDIEKIKAEVVKTEYDLSVAKTVVDKFVRREHGEKRMEELKAEEKTLAKEFEELERQLFLTDLFVKTKVSMLTDRINSKFETVRFKLFHQNINGGIEDCCEIAVNGVGYNSGLNNAARIQAGLDIIRTLQEHFKMRAPVFIDNREAVSEIPKMDCQVINLVVSKPDKVMRVESAVKDKRPQQEQTQMFA